MSFPRQNEIPIDEKLFEAAVKGRFEEFERYADSLDRLLNSKQDTILHIHLNTTTHVRSAEFVRKVFDKCPQLLKQTNANGDTPLHIAARYRHLEMTKLLIELAKTGDLESGKDAVAEARKMMRMVNKDKDTALHEAARWDSNYVVGAILGEEDLDYKYGVNNCGETPLYLAARCRSILSLDAMLKAYKNKPVAYQGPNGKTVLQAAIVFCSDYEEIMSRVIDDMGSLVNEADENGWTPLHYAVCVRHSYVVSKILEKDTSSAYMKDNDRKRTALHIAACLGNINAMTNIISKCCYCAELADYRGWNVAHFAAINKTSQAIHLILEEFPNSLHHLGKYRDMNGYSPIELYFYVTYNTVNYEWNLSMYSHIYYRLRNEPLEEISKKKEEILGWIKELGSGPFGKLVPGILAPEKSPKEKRKEIEEKIIPELEKAKDSHLVAAVLVATVTFAAAFTLPGGYVSDEEKSNNLKLGSPILSKNAAFKAFVISDGIAMVLSISSVFVHFIMVMLGYKQKYYWLLRSAFWFIVIAMGAMVVAFVTGTYAVLAPNSFGLALLTCFIGLSFFAYVFYTVIRLIFDSASDRVIVLNDPYIGPRYLCCGWCKLFFLCCYCCCSLTCYPIYALANMISRAKEKRKQET